MTGEESIIPDRESTVPGDARTPLWNQYRLHRPAGSVDDHTDFMIVCPETMSLSDIDGEEAGPRCARCSHPRLLLRTMSVKDELCEPNRTESDVRASRTQDWKSSALHRAYSEAKVGARPENYVRFSGLRVAPRRPATAVAAPQLQATRRGDREGPEERAFTILDLARSS